MYSIYILYERNVRFMHTHTLVRKLNKKTIKIYFSLKCKCGAPLAIAILLTILFVGSGGAKEVYHFQVCYIFLIVHSTIYVNTFAS